MDAGQPKHTDICDDGEELPKKAAAGHTWFWECSSYYRLLEVIIRLVRMIRNMVIRTAYVLQIQMVSQM